MTSSAIGAADCDWSKIRHTNEFHGGREAKEFLISQIVEEARRKNFEYDQDDYEQRIAKLVAKADQRIREASPDDYDKWSAAIRFLEGEDHYILVMIRSAGLRPR